MLSRAEVARTATLVSHTQTVGKLEMANLNFSYDPFTDGMTIEGTRYSGELFRAFAKGGLAIGEDLKKINRADSVVTIRRLTPREADEANARAV
jgi:hypothetical protein